MTERIKCDVCKGNGKIADNGVRGGVRDCPKCHGEGGWWKS